MIFFHVLRNNYARNVWYQLAQSKKLTFSKHKNVIYASTNNMVVRKFACKHIQLVVYPTIHLLCIILTDHSTFKAMS